VTQSARRICVLLLTGVGKYKLQEATQVFHTVPVVSS